MLHVGDYLFADSGLFTEFRLRHFHKLTIERKIGSGSKLRLYFLEPLRIMEINKVIIFND